MGKPVIISKTFTKDGKPHKIIVKAQLCLHGGEQPYFSITGDTGRWYRHADRMQIEASGAILDEIREAFGGELDDLVAMHLSTMDGKPMHAQSNGWFWLAGALHGLGEQYHGSNGTGRCSPEECLKIFAKHVRISLNEAADLAYSTARIADSYGVGAAKRDFTSWINSQHARWQAEAHAVIRKYRLQLV